jgi:hypothetical protein
MHHVTTRQEPINTDLSPTGTSRKSLDIPKTSTIAVDVKITPNNILSQIIFPTNISGSSTAVRNTENPARLIAAPVKIRFL